jgi:toxin HigB-1
MIISSDKLTKDLYDRNYNKAFPPELCEVAYRKLVMLNAATSLNDLKSPPGNRLEKLSGDRDEKYSIRINDQYRIVFKWVKGNAVGVKVTDYH